MTSASPTSPCVFCARLWRYDGPAAWFFVTLSRRAACHIRAQAGLRRPGFGSVRVRAALGDLTWRTSVFPDAKSGSYLLPIKAAIRRQSAWADGTTRRIAMVVLD